ncbi:MAG: two-component system heavy metal sensor histidine kinase CusS [Psychromonas sp.]|jgi:two-component system heavy metal sensor histidine kinase CusS|uniref:ATP-binding protein n=1 Tax=Psychromonas sp. TaxID=1884585 RepID=UPI0039E49F2D
MSFRTRIFAISILTVSTVLIVVMAISWSRIMQVELDHLDTRLCMEAKRLVPEKHLADQPVLLSNTPAGQNLTNDLAEKLRIHSLQQLMVLVESSQQGIKFQSDTEVNQRFINDLDWPAAKTVLPDVSLMIAANQESALHNRKQEVCQLVSFTNQQGEWRAGLYTLPYARSFVAVDIAATNSDLQSAVHTALIVVIPVAILLSALGAWFIASITIRPLNRLHNAMQMVTSKEFAHRLPEHKEDNEFKVLIDVYNTMLDRLEYSFQQTSRFTADAAHELKTPLTILQGRLELAVNQENPRLVDLNSILDEVGNLSAITRKLLLLSQADSGSLAIHPTKISITDLLDEMIDDLELLSEQQILHCNIKRDLNLKGDTLLLRQLFNNLLSNAMRYCQPEQGITINASLNGTVIEVFISNHCRPISSHCREHLFDRFYRGEPAHYQGISGSGLGLSLAREIARAHGGDLLLEPTAENVVTLKLSLPVSKLEAGKRRA